MEEVQLDVEMAINPGPESKKLDADHLSTLDIKKHIFSLETRILEYVLKQRAFKHWKEDKPNPQSEGMEVVSKKMPAVAWYQQLPPDIVNLIDELAMITVAMGFLSLSHRKRTIAA